MMNSKVFVLLVGEKTRFLYRFVRWEIELAIKKDLPIIVVNLNNKRTIDRSLCPAIARDTLAILKWTPLSRHGFYENKVGPQFCSFPAYSPAFPRSGSVKAYCP